MPAMLSLILECGSSMAGSSARLALRIRVSMSEIGSFIGLPTGFGYARNQPVKGALAEGHPRAAELAQIAVTASAHRAPVDHSRGPRIPRQFSQTRVVALGLQLGPNRGVFLDRLGLLLVAFNPRCLSHNQLLRFYF